MGFPSAGEFDAAVQALASAAPPADPENLSGMSMDVDCYLWHCPSIREVEVTSSPDPARQLTARCLAEPDATPDRVAEEITRAWLTDLRYSYWEAHTCQVGPASVEFHAATRIGDGDYFITVAVLVRWDS